MKYIITLLLLFLIIGCPFAPHYHRETDYQRTQQITLTENIGDVLDVTEREQYDLFPNVDFFAEARFFAIGGGGYVVEILAGSALFVSVNRDPSAIDIIRYYIDNYELVKINRTAFEKKWHMVGYDDIGQPITNKEIENMGLMGSTGPCLMGAAAGGCLGGVTGCLIGVAISDYNWFAGDKISPGYFIGGAIGGALAGGSLSSHLYKKRVIQEIRDSRRLRRID
jgi:hypothetical protein